MKIGWCRLTMLIQIDLNQTPTGFSGMRTGYMKALVGEGHTIKLLTKLGKESRESYEHVKSGKDPEELGSWDCSWFNSLEHEPEGFADDCDLLIVEASACNWMFHTGGKPAIRRCAEILNSFKGQVIIEQSDPDLPFPFGKLSMAEFPYSHEDNPYRLKTEKGHQELERYGWADPDEIWMDKKYCVCVRAESGEALMRDGVAKGKRFQYDKLLEDPGDQFKILAMPQTYDFESHNIMVKDRNNTEKEYDLVYTGYPRSDSREKKFNELFMGGTYDHCLKRAICGPWTKSKRAQNLFETQTRAVHYAGNLPWAELPVFLNKSKFALFLGVSKAYLMNWQTNKPFETISSGAVLLHDSIGYLDKWFDNMFQMNDGNRDMWWYTMYHITDKDLKILRNYQWAKVRRCSWDLYLNRLRDVLGVLVGTKGGADAAKKPACKKQKILAVEVLQRYEQGWSKNKDWRQDWGVVDKLMANQKISDEECQEAFDPPECFTKEYDQENSYCEISCPFRIACKLNMAEPDKPEAEYAGDEELPEDTGGPKLEEGEVTHPQAPFQLIEGGENAEHEIVLQSDRSCLVIRPCEGKDLTVTFDGHTVHFTTKNTE